MSHQQVHQTCYYFGTFNPIHFGHLFIAQQVIPQFGESLGIDSITFVPTGRPPHKQALQDPSNHASFDSVCSASSHWYSLTDPYHRLKMVQLAIANNPQFKVSKIEQPIQVDYNNDFFSACPAKNQSGNLTQDNSPHYTVYTVEALLKLRAASQPTIPPEKPLYCILGSDTVEKLPTWFQIKALLPKIHILQAPRPDSPVLHSIVVNGSRCDLATSILEMPTWALSSSWIRQEAFRIFTLEQNQRLKETYKVAFRYCLPESVIDYIADNKLWLPAKAGLIEQH